MCQPVFISTPLPTKALTKGLENQNKFKKIKGNHKTAADFSQFCCFSYIHSPAQAMRCMPPSPASPGRRWLTQWKSTRFEHEPEQTVMNLISSGFTSRISGSRRWQNTKGKSIWNAFLPSASLHMGSLFSFPFLKQNTIFWNSAIFLSPVCSWTQAAKSQTSLKIKKKKQKNQYEWQEDMDFMTPRGRE